MVLHGSENTEHSEICKKLLWPPMGMTLPRARLQPASAQRECYYSRDEGGYTQGRRQGGGMRFAPSRCHVRHLWEPKIIPQVGQSCAVANLRGGLHCRAVACT